MKIVLAEERNGGLSPEKSFEEEIIRIGRDADACRINFDNNQYPMVSRKHAEIRWTNKGWMVWDLNSTYGTFINGQKIAAPQTISINDRIQFGTQGPILKVIRTDAAGFSQNASPQQNFPNPSAPLPPPPSMPQSYNQQQQQSGNAPPTQLMRLEFVENPSRPALNISKESLWLGRDPNGDVVFDANAVMVSRKHAEIRRENGKFIVHDNGSFNGTLINEQRISMPTPLYHDDQIRLGPGGPVVRFNAPQFVAPKGAKITGQRAISGTPAEETGFSDENFGTKTITVNLGTPQQQKPKTDTAQPTLLMSLAFGNKNQLIIGRDETSDIKLDGLQISNQHAKIYKTSGSITIEDLGSTNGVYIGGRRISRQTITPQDAVQIGSFLIKIDNQGNVGVFDTRSKTRIDAVNITKDVKNRAGGGMIRLLDDVSLTIQPNEFVGMLGPSGAGKSTLMDAMNGMRPASGGSIRINNLDLYEHLDSLKQSIGYVPQDDIIHRELTVYRTLYYVAKLRLSRDVSTAEINQIIDEVLDVTGLTERRDVPISQLSGGQRKRVSIAVELITKPSVIFLDEPTSGLDPATEEKIMNLFRQIAESGRTVILTTHAMENVKLFDKIIVLMRGKLAFYGAPDEALNHLKAKSFKELYDKLEEPIEQEIQRNPNVNRQQITEQTAESWKQKFKQTPQYNDNVKKPLQQLGNLQSSGVRKHTGLGLIGAIRQFLTLSRRYTEVLLRDKLNLFILFAQAPIVAFMTFIVMGEEQPRDFVYFVLSIVSVWFGTSIAAREIVREQVVYARERMVNLGILPYVASKLFVLGFIVGVQCLLLFLPLKFFDLVGAMPMPGQFAGIPQLWVVFLTAGVGIALGLLVSALVKTSEMATSLVPLILIPQILFSGLVGVPELPAKPIGMLMPATWSFDTMKRYSSLDTLEEDGAKEGGKNEGKGLYKFVKDKNNEIIEDAKNDIDEYKEDAEKKIDEFEDELKRKGSADKPKLDDPPEIEKAEPIPDDLSEYVSFLHPWMHEIVNQFVLIIMFFGLVIGTLIVLRIKDIK